MVSQAQRLIGKQLGTCVLEQLIGIGGMGVVYLAQQTRPTREVAVKVLRIDTQVPSGESEEFLARFRREANVIARLDHVNILPIYEYGEQDGLAYLVMPYLTGGSLRTHLKERGPLPAEEALMYVEQAAAALQYAHGKKVVHRDIKPGNMLFHSDGRLVLVDFGIARITHENNELTEESITGSGNFIGSVEYMAPEMALGQRIDYRADIYELGIVLFQMLSGQVPFKGSSAFVIANRHVHDTPPSLCQLNPAISPAVNEVVQKALAKQPDDRYQSATELAQALRKAIHNPDDTIRKSLAAISTEHMVVPSAAAQSSLVRRDIEASQSRASATTFPDNGGRSSPVFSTPIPLELSEPPRERRSLWWLKAGIILGILAIFLVGGVFLAKNPALLAQVYGSVQTPPTTPIAHPTSPSRPTPSPTVRATPTMTPSQQAQTLVQHYYDDINKHDYHAAYQLLGVDFQQKNPYPQYVAGFAKTQLDTITINQTVVQNDGTVEVDLTLDAQMITGTDNTYKGRYIVGTEDGTLKILNGVLH